jgi:osmoprotectant transport system substrate-binding protein
VKRRGVTNERRSVSRAAALALLGGAATFVAGCGPGSATTVSIGAKDFTEERILGELYAQLLEENGFTVVRKLDLAGTQIAMEALQRGDIDLYPEYTGTALIAVLNEKPSKNAAANYATVKREYESRYRLTWLDVAPFDDSQALATTQAIRDRFHLTTLSDLSKAAPKLRLGAIPEFTKREDALPGLQKAYGGFEFADVKLFEIGIKYKALELGQIDVVVAASTDAQIALDHLYVFVDDKHFWPSYQVAPVVRDDTLRAHPEIAGFLNKLAPLLDDDTMRALNAQVDGDKKDPVDVAQAFLAQHGLA